MQFRLLAERRFGPLLAVQLLAALNDQAFMQALMVVLAYRTASFTVLGADTLLNLAQGLFAPSAAPALGARRPAR